MTARDRAWQLEWLRRRATGTTAELFGEPGLPWDEFARRIFLADTGRRALDALSEESRGFVTAYVDGLNDGLAGATAPELTDLGIDAEPWPAWMPLAAFHAQQVLFANLGGVLWERLARSVLGAEARLLTHEGLALSGSNAWAVGGARTASGLPLVAGDPHRVIEQPGIYQQVRLECDDPDDRFDVVGFTFVGVPGVQHFAHAGPVAWAITNGMADYQDVHDEAVPPSEVLERRVETIAVRDAEPVAVEIVRTRRGVVFEDGLSLRDPATEQGDLGFESLLPLLRARTVDDVDRALDHWVVPVNNVVVADTSGAVRYRLAGLVPTRDADGAWGGWLDADTTGRHDVAADGQVVTANERRGPESDLVGAEFAPPYRADRIGELLAGRTGLTAADMAAVHGDPLLGTVPALTSLVPGAFDDFDGRMDAGSPAAGRFAAWRSALVRLVVAQPVFAGIREPAPEHRHSPVFAPWLGLTFTVAQSLPTLIAAGTPFGIDLAALAREALAEVDAAGASLSWGDTHVAAPVHAFDLMGRPAPSDLPAPPLSGDADCVCATASYPATTDACSRGPVARYVWDLADREAGGWVVPTGASGDPAHPHHHDQLAAWAAAALVPIVTDWDRLTPEE